MSLSDDLIKQKQEDEAATESIKLRQLEWSKAVDALLNTIEAMLAEAIEVQAVTVTRGTLKLGGELSMPTLSIVRMTKFRHLISQPVTIEPAGMSRMRIHGGAVMGHRTALLWSGSGEGLSSWRIPFPGWGPRLMSHEGKRRHRVNGANGTNGSNGANGSSGSNGAAAQALTQEKLEAVLRRYLGLGACAQS